MLMFSLFLIISCKKSHYTNEGVTFELTLRDDSTYTYIYPALLGLETVENGEFKSNNDSLVLLRKVKRDSIHAIDSSFHTSGEDIIILKRRYIIIGDTIIVNDMRKVTGPDNRLIKKENTSDNAVYYIKYR